MNFQTDTNKLNNVVYRYRNNMYLKGDEIDLKLTEYQSLLAKRVYHLSYIDIFYGALYWMKQMFIIKTNSGTNGCYFPHEHFPIVPGIKNVI